MTRQSSQELEQALPGGLDHSKMMRLLGYNLAQAAIPSNKLFDKHIGEPFALKQVEFSILVLLSNNDNVSPKQLSLGLGVLAPNMTLILDRLEKRNLISRSPSDNDRRALHVALTRAGKALLAKAEAVAATMEQELLKFLTQAERAMLFELLQRVAIHRRV